MIVASEWYSAQTTTFGDRLTAAREHSGMSKSQLARRIGIKNTTLNAWENDISEPRANRLSMLAGCLNVSVMWLLNGEGVGLSAPEEVTEKESEDLNRILVEIQDLNNNMRSSADRLSRLENKMRHYITE